MKKLGYLKYSLLLVSALFLVGCPPSPVTILTPSDGDHFEVGDEITFTGSAIDFQDGELDEDSLIWISSIDVEIGTGTEFAREYLTEGTHEITLTATNSLGETGTATITITIGEGTVTTTTTTIDDNTTTTTTIDDNPTTTTIHACGDGIVNTTAGEECDDGGESATCNYNCTPHAYGDGIVNTTAGEECDDGNTQDGDGCDSEGQWEGDSYENDNSAAAATHVITSANWITDHTIEPCTDVDYFSVEMTAGLYYRVTTGGRSNQYAEVDTVLTLYDTDGTTQLARNDDSSSISCILCSQIKYTPTVSGEYFFSVSASGQRDSGFYRIEFQDTNIFIGSSVNIPTVPGSITDITDDGSEFWFDFSATNGSQYTVSITNSNCQSGDESVLELWVYKEDLQTLIGHDGEKRTEICAAVAFTATESGAHYIRIKQRNEMLYTFDVEVTSP
jgi:cysteine-rich repeat protein